jgi:hypothetical protein
LQYSIGTTRRIPPRVRPLAAAALLSGVLVAGCGGSSSSPTSATAGGAITSASTTAAGGGPNSGSTPTGALAFSKCMRASGVPNFPDPSPGGGFEFNASAGTIASPAFRAAQGRCQKLLPGGPLSPGPPPSAQTTAQLRRIAVCMREHGVPQFPDPRATPPPQSSVIPGEYTLITNYKGAILLFPRTINMQSPAYKRAAAACGAGFLAHGD